MDIGIGLPNMVPSLARDVVVDWSVRSEDAGFSSLSTGERLSFAMNDAFVELTMAATVTRRIRLLTSVVVMPLHSTAMLAKQAASLSCLSGGRLHLGVGSGGHPADYDLAGLPWADRISRFEQQLRDVQAFWRGEPIGPTGAVLGPLPAGPLPILIGPSTPKAAERCHLADGLITFFWDDDTAAQEALFRVASEAWKSHDRPGRPRWVAGLFFALGPNARTRAETTLRAYYQSFGQPGITVEEVLRVVRTTSDDSVSNAIKRFSDAGADELILCPLVPDLDQVDRLHAICK